MTLRDHVKKAILVLRWDSGHLFEQLGLSRKDVWKVNPRQPLSLSD